MPLFPSFSRSKKSRGRARDDYSVYDHYPTHEEPPQQAPAWRTVAPSSGDHRDSWDEVEYPESYNGLGDYHRGASSSTRRRRGEREHTAPIPIHESDRNSQSTVTPLEHGYGAAYEPRYDGSVPLVQRESSLGRLQEAFADHAPTTRPVTELSLPQGTPYPSPRQGVPLAPSSASEPSRSAPAMAPQPMRAPSGSAQMRGIYAEPRQPVLVPQGPNMAVHSERPEHVGRMPSAPRGRREERRTHSSRDYHRRDRSDSSGRTPDDSDDEYPPCVIVVERGRNGKKDTYYVIPGGAPVVFEDEEGNELTRVGDFSGRYKPRRQRPVIIEDENGREIGRLGFDDESSLDYAYRNRSHDDMYDHDRNYDRRHGDREYYDDRGSTRSHRSHRSQHVDRDYAQGASRDYTRSRTVSNSSRPNLVYIPYKDTFRASDRYVEDRPSRRHYEPSHRSQHSHRSRHSSSSRSHNSTSPVIHLDDIRYRSPESVASGSSGRRSYDDVRSYPSSHRR